MQKVQVIGNLAADPRPGQMPSGDIVSNFTVIENHKWTDRNGHEHDRKTTFQCTVTGRQADACNQYLWSGREVYVEGHLKADQWGNPLQYTHQATGEVRTSNQLVIHSIDFLGSQKDRPGYVAPNGQDVEDDVASTFGGQQTDPIDEIPF